MAGTDGGAPGCGLVLPVTQGASGVVQGWSGRLWARRGRCPAEGTLPSLPVRLAAAHSLSHLSAPPCTKPEI